MPEVGSQKSEESEESDERKRSDLFLRSDLREPMTPKGLLTLLGHRVTF